MRNLIINYFFLYREFKLFGQEIKVVRAAAPSVLAFFFGVLLQTLLDAGTFVTILCWIPFMVAAYLGFFYFLTNPLKYDELEDWQQQWQYLHKPSFAGNQDSTYPKGMYYNSEVKRLAELHSKHFGGYDNVDVILGIAPTLITIIGAALFVLIY